MTFDEVLKTVDKSVGNQPSQHRLSPQKDARIKQLAFNKIIANYLKSDRLVGGRIRSIYSGSQFKKRFKSNIDFVPDLVVQIKGRPNQYWPVFCRLSGDEYQQEIQRIKEWQFSRFLVNNKWLFFSRQILILSSLECQVIAVNNWSVEASVVPTMVVDYQQLSNPNQDWAGLIKKPTFGKLGKEPRPYQTEAIQAAFNYFVDRKRYRGQIVLPPGTGKTLTSLWLAESDLVPEGGLTLILVEDLDLLTRAARTYADNSPNGDKAVYLGIDHYRDWVNDLVPVIKNGRSAKEALMTTSDLKFVFATYRSLPDLVKIQRKLGLVFNLVVYDEAQRLINSYHLTNKTARYIEPGRGQGLNASLHLFLTSTPRLYHFHNQQKLLMSHLCDNRRIFGDLVYWLPFEAAVSAKAVRDWRLVVVENVIDDKNDYKSQSVLSLNRRRQIRLSNLLLSTSVVLRPIVKVQKASTIPKTGFRLVKRLAADIWSATEAHLIAKYWTKIKTKSPTKVVGLTTRIEDQDLYHQFVNKPLSRKQVLVSPQLEFDFDQLSFDGCLVLTKRQLTDRDLDQFLKANDRAKRAVYFVVPLAINPPPKVGFFRKSEPKVKSYQPVWSTLKALMAFDDRLRFSLNLSSGSFDKFLSNKILTVKQTKMNRLVAPDKKWLQKVIWKQTAAKDFQVKDWEAELKRSLSANRLLLKDYLMASVSNRKSVVSLKRQLEDVLGRRLSGRELNTVICRHLVISPLLVSVIKTIPLGQKLTSFVNIDPKHWQNPQTFLVESVSNYRQRYSKEKTKSNKKLKQTTQAFCRDRYLTFVVETDRTPENLSRLLIEILENRHL